MTTPASSAFRRGYAGDGPAPPGGLEAVAYDLGAALASAGSDPPAAATRVKALLERPELTPALRQAAQALAATLAGQPSPDDLRRKADELERVLAPPPPLGPEDTAAVATLLVTVFPELAGALAQRRLQTRIVPQPWFRRHRIVNVAIDRHPPPPEVVHVAISESGAITVLTRRLEALAHVAAADPPLGLDRPDEALRYAHLADRWTTEYSYGQLPVTSFEDIPWRRVLDDRDRARIEEVKARAAPRLAPERIEPVPGGFAVTAWIVAHQKLIHRVLTVLMTGELRREDEIVVEKIPTYLGKLWKVDARGRMVPSS